MFLSKISTLNSNVLSCVNIDGESRLKNDLGVVCYQGEHKFWSLSIAVPSIIAWALGIPFFAFLLMFKERKTLDSISTREKFGFLFRGYKHRLFFWEVIIMYRKIALIFIQVFLI